MSDLFEIRLESDLSEFTSTETGGGDLAWSNDATAQAVVSTSGALKVVVNDTTPIYGEYNLGTSSTTGTFRCRFHVDPNGISVPEYDQFALAKAYNAIDEPLLQVTLGNEGGVYWRVATWDDASEYYTVEAEGSDTPTCVEVQLTRATNGTSNDGTLRLWIDGVSAGTPITNLDNYDRFSDFDYARFGAADSIPSGTSGTCYLDEIKANDDGTEIGPYGGGAPPSSTGAKYPASAQSIAEGDWQDEDWVNPTNIYSDDANYASITANSFDNNDQSYVLKAYNFDMSSVPDGSTINGVECIVNCYYAVGSCSMDLMQLLDESRAKVGTNQCATPVALGTDSAGTITKGSSSDTWGNSLTVAWVKDADFGVALGFKATGNNCDLFVDYVTLNVHFTAPGGGGESYCHAWAGAAGWF